MDRMSSNTNVDLEAHHSIRTSSLVSQEEESLSSQNNAEYEYYMSTGQELPPGLDRNYSLNFRANNDSKLNSSQDAA